MPHTTRSARKANAARKKAHAKRCQPLPMAEQLRRAELNAAAHAARYPVPPVYADSYERKSRTQPACYTPGVDVLSGLLAAMGMRRSRAR